MTCSVVYCLGLSCLVCGWGGVVWCGVVASCVLCWIVLWRVVLYVCDGVCVCVRVCVAGTVDVGVGVVFV